MRLTVFATAALSSAVALVGFAGMANASATVDLVWIDISSVDTAGNPICLKPAKRNCPVLGSELTGAGVSDLITLGVLITAGPQRLLAAGVDVDYSGAQPKISVDSFQSFTTTRPFVYFPIQFTEPLPIPNDSVDGLVQFFEAHAILPPVGPLGIGLPPGASAYLGTVTFHKDSLINGTFDILVNTEGGASDIIDEFGDNISALSTFNSATLINVPEPGALSLLVMGLGGMLLAGRGRRS